MALVAHDPAYRRIWMMPRNKRKVPPIWLCQTIELISSIDTFSGDQNAQNKFAESLEIMGLKKPGVQYHSHSGGPRTYKAQLEALGFIFDYEGRIHLTIAGEAMVNAEKPLQTLQLNLLRHQYPSMYAEKSNVKIHPGLKVRPFQFLLRLLKQFGHLSKNEIAIAVIYGHNDGCLELCGDKITLLRGGESFLDVVDDPETDFYTPRTRDRVIAVAQRDVLDIANTFKNVLLSSRLIEELNLDGIGTVIILNSQFQVLVGETLETSSPFLSTASHLQFQRSYGRGNRTKDTRSLIKEPKSTLAPLDIAIVARYREILGKDFTRSDEDISALLEQDYGLEKKQITTALAPVIGHRMGYFESEYYRMSTGGAPTAIAFEKATTWLINQLGEDSAMELTAEHTGQRSRPGLGGFSDILVRHGGNLVSIVDAKAISDYCLPADNMFTMTESYIPSHGELLSDGENRRLSSVGYVPASECNTMAKRLSELENLSGVAGFSMTAPDLFRCVSEKDSDAFLAVLSC